MRIRHANDRTEQYIEEKKLKQKEVEPAIDETENFKNADQMAGTNLSKLFLKALGSIATRLKR